MVGLIIIPSKFTSPLARQNILPPHNTDYDVSPRHRIHHYIAGHLTADPPLNELIDEILFWIFHSSWREDGQLVTAREWEQSTYYCWDPLYLTKMTHQLTINYADLDSTPTTHQLPSSSLDAKVRFKPTLRSTLTLNSAPTIANAPQPAAATVQIDLMVQQHTLQRTIAVGNETGEVAEDGHHFRIP
ncbi:hypothetical protein TSMEX_000872 [Taenia solium]|eukprot:TsM_000163000 transcript=TsM_000163000 gene=TsM_000163000